VAFDLGTNSLFKMNEIKQNYQNYQRRNNPELVRTRPDKSQLILHLDDIFTLSLLKKIKEPANLKLAGVNLLNFSKQD
jgi:hypothetical protein